MLKFLPKGDPLTVTSLEACPLHFKHVRLKVQLLLESSTAGASSAERRHELGQGSAVALTRCGFGSRLELGSFLCCLGEAALCVGSRRVLGELFHHTRFSHRINALLTP